MQNKRTLIAVIFGVATALLMSQCPVWSQVVPPEVDTSPDAATLANAYISYSLGISGQYADAQNNTYDVTGRFGIASIKGDPETTLDDNINILGLADTAIENAMVVWVNKANHNIANGEGQWVKQPTVYSQPAAGQAKGVNGPYMEAEWLTNAANNGVPISVRLFVYLVRDQVRWDITLTNKGVTSQNVGFSLLTVPHTSESGGVTFPFVPGVGQVLASGSGGQYYGKIFKGATVPTFVEIFDDVMNPVVTTRFTLRQQDCTPPDYFALSDLASTAARLTTVQISDPTGANYYLPDPMAPITSLGVIEEWAQKALAPGASRRIITYFGMGAASAAWTHASGTTVKRDHAVLAVQGPRAVKYDTDAGTGLSPDTFSIKAYVYNLDVDPGPYDLKDVSAFLFLPKGLELDMGSSAQQAIGPVAINSEAAPATWTVRATGDYVGPLTYYVSVRDTSGWQQIVSRSIMVPAVKHTLVTGGFQMVSVPYTANEPTLEHLFGWSSGSFFAKSFDPSVNAYQTLTTVVPGQGFWMAYSGLATGATRPVTLAIDAQIAGEVIGRQLGLISVELKAGWNMIGDPYVYPIYLGQLMVYSKNTETISFDEAVSKNLISRTLFTWNSSKGAYEYVKTNDSYLLPWKGYWMYVRVPSTLMFRPAAWPGGSVTTQLGGF